jgi:hypothetical protein
VALGLNDASYDADLASITDTMPQAIKLIHAEGRSCMHAPITQDGKVVDSQGYELDREDK